MNAIVAADSRWAIGRAGGLLFSLPGDMRRFRILTTGGTVIMGRKTLDSFPGGKPLPKRRNIVVTRNAAFSREGCECVESPEAALALAGDYMADDVWLIGGGAIYAALLPRCRQVFLTRVEAVAQEADTFFPDLDALPGWEVAHTEKPLEENGLVYRFIDYVNKNI